MFVFLTVAGGLLIASGALLLVMSIEPTSLCPSWNELQRSFRIMAGRPQFRIGAICLILGLIMMLGLTRLLMWW